MTLPTSWAHRRLVVPNLLILHYADVPAGDRTWVGLVPVTKPTRTLRDVIDDHGDPDMIDQAIADGLASRAFRREDLRGIVSSRRALQTVR
jgi:hypothetical protein